MTIAFFGTDGQLFAFFDTFCLRSIDSGTSHIQSQNWPVGGRLGRFWEVWVGIGASSRVVYWLKNGFPLTFNSQVVSVWGMPPLTRASSPSLLTVYRDQVKNVALRDMVLQLLEKQFVRVMTETETGFSGECS